LSTCGKRRRWTAEQKHKIVAEGMEPDASAAIVAGRHVISTGQFYAWRQQLLLAERSAPGPTPFRVWRASMRRRARRTWIF
jgi:transposase-like protein